MRLLKASPILSLVNSYIVDSPQPANLSYAWNFGSLLATCLVVQIITGVLLAMHYTPNVDLAFVSVEHVLMCFLKWNKCFERLIYRYQQAVNFINFINFFIIFY